MSCNLCAGDVSRCLHCIKAEKGHCSLQSAEACGALVSPSGDIQGMHAVPCTGDTRPACAVAEPGSQAVAHVAARLCLLSTAHGNRASAPTAR